MNLIKQDVGVWVRASDESPDTKYLIREISTKKIVNSEITGIVDGNIYFNYGGIFSFEYYEWLKPIKQVYLFTPDELGRLIKDALLWYDDSAGSIDYCARDFLNSITK